jgi:hypothetical protein
MSGDHAKKEKGTGDKPITSHEKDPSGESRNKGKEDEEGGLLRDRLFITIDLRLRHAVRNF